MSHNSIKSGTGRGDSGGNHAAGNSLAARGNYAQMPLSKGILKGASVQEPIIQHANTYGKPASPPTHRHEDASIGIFMEKNFRPMARNELDALIAINAAEQKQAPTVREVPDERAIITFSSPGGSSYGFNSSGYSMADIPGC